jgi:hypothetical protein
MEMISNTFELVALFTLAAWFGAPSARTAWARIKTRRDEEPFREDASEPSPDVFRGER